MNKKRFSYKHLFNALNHFNFRRMQECATLIQWLNPKAGEHILDIGCGDGYYDHIIAKAGAKVTGIDLHERRLAVAQRLYRSEQSDFLYLDAEKMDFPKASFDQAVSFCVMEHLHDDERVMQNVANVLKAGGYFVFSADSLSNPGITAEERARHCRRYAVKTFYNEKNLREKLSRAGFDMQEWQYILSKPFELALFRLSWKLDKLPSGLAVFKMLGYMTLGIAWKLSTLFRGRQNGRPKSQHGLTMLVRARKRS